MLVAGGQDSSGTALASAELYDPNTGTWSATGSMASPRVFHTATLLPNGRVLVAGGDLSGTSFLGSDVLSSAEMYDPASGTWSALPVMTTARAGQSATLLPNGNVLVAGGNSGSGTSQMFPVTSTELFDPASDTWMATGSMSSLREGQTATLLPNGIVLVAGGCCETGFSFTEAETYDAGTGAWTVTGSMNTARIGQTATLLSDGTVLVAGGTGYGYYFGDHGASWDEYASAESYDPDTGIWSNTGIMTTARSGHTATLLPNGTVLVAGGQSSSGSDLASAELYTPGASPFVHLQTAYLSFGNQVVGMSSVTQSVTITNTGSLPLDVSSIAISGSAASDFQSTNTCIGTPIPPAGTCAVGIRFAPVASGTWLNASVIITDNAPDEAQSFTVSGYAGDARGPVNWSPTGSMTIPRTDHTATLLPSGKVLVAGGTNWDFGQSSAELYDPATGTWTATGSMSVERWGHTATLLPNGTVLVAGGNSDHGTLASAELYNPATGTWIVTGSMVTARANQTAVLLPNGKVLVAGGTGATGPLASAELYDPNSGTWSVTGSMSIGRVYHTMTLLQNGSVLVAGGQDADEESLASAELYNPSSGTWTSTGGMSDARAGHTATLLQDGRVLAAAGSGASGYLSSAELYDPATGTWTATGSMNYARSYAVAVLLNSGKVLVDGNSELYDPLTGTWAPGFPSGNNQGEQMTLLASGQILLEGGCCVSVSASLFTPVSLSVGPASGSLQPVTVSGANFGAGEPVAMYWDTTGAPVFLTTTSTAAGAVSATMPLPPLSVGAHTLLAIGQNSGLIGGASFTVIQPSATPSPAATATPSATPTRSTATPLPSNSPTSTATATLPSPTATHTSTPLPMSTNTPTPTGTNTRMPASTSTPTPTDTRTSVPINSSTPTPTSTNTPAGSGNTPTPTDTSTPIATDTNISGGAGRTPQPTSTSTSRPIPTSTNTPAPTNTSTSVPPPAPTSTTTPITPTRQPLAPTDTPVPPEVTQTPAPRPTQVPTPLITVSIVRGILAGNSTIEVSFHTGKRAAAVITLKLTRTTTTVVGKGKKRKHVTKTVLLYGMTSHTKAGARGPAQGQPAHRLCAGQGAEGAAGRDGARRPQDVHAPYRGDGAGTAQTPAQALMGKDVLPIGGMVAHQ